MVPFKKADVVFGIAGLVISLTFGVLNFIKERKEIIVLTKRDKEDIAEKTKKAIFKDKRVKFVEILVEKPE